MGRSLEETLEGVELPAITGSLYPVAADAPFDVCLDVHLLNAATYPDFRLSLADDAYFSKSVVLAE